MGASEDESVAHQIKECVCECIECDTGKAMSNKWFHCLKHSEGCHLIC